MVYLLNVIGLALLDMWGVWLMEMAFLLGSVWLIYAVVKDRFGPAATLFPIAVFSGYFVIFAQGGNYTEQYALLFQFLTLYLFTRVEKGNKGEGYYKLFLVSIGALAAATFLLRPNLVGMWLAIGIYWIFVCRDDALRRLMWSGVGAAAALLPVIWIFAIFGGLYHFWDAVFIYNFTYSDAPLLERIKAVWHIGGSRLTLILLPTIASWSIGLYYFRSAEVAGRERFEDIVKLSVIALPIEVFFVSVSALDYGHYYLAMLPAVVTLMAVFSYGITKVVSLPAPLLSAILLIFVASYYIPVALNSFPVMIERLAREDGVMGGKHLRVAERIREETDLDDPILVWGAQSQLYLLSERDAPTRFFYQYPLALSGYANPELFGEFISDVKDEVPALIVDTRNDRLPPLDSAERGVWEINTHRYVYSPDRFQPFFDFVEEEYEFVEEIESYAIYKKIE